jgi:hypothetical protein
MTVADMIPTLDDAALANLRSNARRLEAGADGPRRQEAIDILPLIDAELTQRAANKPPKPARKTRAKAAPTA